MALFTESGVRACIRVKDGRRVFYLGPDDRLTPSAREWLSRESIEILPESQQKPKSYQTLFGGTLTEKPEHMTHLRGNILVFKDHPRIAFRGQIDLLEAEILLAQQVAHRDGRSQLVRELEEILQFVRNLIRADVLEEPVEEFHLLGLSPAQLREQSHYPQKYFGQSHFMPSWEDPPSLLALNKVRTVIRSTELAAYRAFRDENGTAIRPDILLALNRLSSLFWILEIRLKAEGNHHSTAFADRT